MSDSDDFFVEVAVGAIDGVNTTFTTSRRIEQGPVMVWLNGILSDATISWEYHELVPGEGQVLVLKVTFPAPPLLTDVVQLGYCPKYSV